MKVISVGGGTTRLRGTALTHESRWGGRGWFFLRKEHVIVSYCWSQDGRLGVLLMALEGKWVGEEEVGDRGEVRLYSRLYDWLTYVI